MSTKRLRCFGVTPLSSRVATLNDYQLSFDTYHPYLPFLAGLANIAPRKGSIVSGVLHLLPQWSRVMLDVSELVLLSLYRRVNLEVRVVSGERYTAAVYVGQHLRSGIPTRKYMAGILRGAREFNLPSSWVRALEQFSVQ